MKMRAVLAGMLLVGSVEAQGLLVIAALAGCGMTPLERADAAQFADVGTTAIGLASGLSEGNAAANVLVAQPGGIVLLLVVKLLVNRGLQDHPAALGAHEGLGWAAAAHNAALIW